MKNKITHEEDELITKSFKDASSKEMFTILWWELINSKKIHLFVAGLTIGKSFKYAFQDAKLLK